jgi:hypothetical protein
LMASIAPSLKVWFFCEGIAYSTYFSTFLRFPSIKKGGNYSREWEIRFPSIKKGGNYSREWEIIGKKDDIFLNI